jgi:diaminohydroxyphosphoribosylaminopyrimidine deaminase/5-amino-6-(5-phosphoribosylamino)uracil reductase
LELAKLGAGNVHPNPMVGCVIVCDGKIIGEGYHRKFGESHAEVNAIASVKNPELLEKSTLYVSLEPCNHIGKTPACSHLIVQSGIPKVVVAMTDPFELVAGSGISTLQASGTEVITGVMESEAKELNKAFLTYHTKKRPFVEAKIAQTADRFIAHASGRPLAITGTLTNLVNHKLRTTIDAIAVGYYTALNDNPALTPRLWHGKNPLRVVFDRNGNLPGTLKLFTDGGETVVITEAAETDYSSCKQVRLIQHKHGNEIQTALDYLYQVGITHLLVEGGTKLIEKFMKADVVDSVRTYTNRDMHLKKGIKAPTFGLSTLKEYELNETTLRILSASAN